MSNSNNRETYYKTLGLAPDATLDQVKTRYKELNEAYLKILELSRNSPKNATSVQPKQQSTKSPTQEIHTEAIATIKEKFAKGSINKTHFEKLAIERYNYLKNKPFSELSDEELDERLRGFEGLNIDPKYWKSKTS